MKIAFEWEKLDEDTTRAKIIGGWIIYISDHDDETGNPVGACMVFIPDTNHEWKI